MARIRKIEISNFRGIKKFEWMPSPGINCLIGPGDSGKSTILDAIDLCLGARRNAQFSDSDFHGLDVSNPISIALTIGDLDDALKNFDTYGIFLRSFNQETGVVEDEPEKDGEIVLTLMLTISSDLEPVWTLVSDRAIAQGISRNLTWGDRVRLAPTRIGAAADYHLGWRRGSVLNRLSDESVDVSATLVGAARKAREAFGDQADGQLGETLGIVAEVARQLGISVGKSVKAMLDAHSVSFAGGTVSLHDESGVPLHGLGLGSTRLLTAGLQRRASTQSSIILVDEIEHGLEPHRIIRFLGSLGAKETTLPPLQAFLTSHSAVVLRELSGDQLFVLRNKGNQHAALRVGNEEDFQGTIRAFPDAFLAVSVLVNEGASEVGLVRGIDLYRVEKGGHAIASFGVALLDSGGGDPNRAYRRAETLHALGYRVAVLRDDDVKPAPETEKAFVEAGGRVFSWRDGRALEDELFLSLAHSAVHKLLNFAIDLHGEELIDAHIKSASSGSTTLNQVRAEIDFTGKCSEQTRAILGKASRTKAAWFKRVSAMEDVARHIVGPGLKDADPGFRELVDSIFEWATAKRA